MGSTGEAVNLEIELVSGGGGDTIGALIIRNRVLGGRSYYNHKKEPPKQQR